MVFHIYWSAQLFKNRSFRCVRNGGKDGGRGEERVDGGGRSRSVLCVGATKQPQITNWLSVFVFLCELSQILPLNSLHFVVCLSICPPPFSRLKITLPGGFSQTRCQRLTAEKLSSQYDKSFWLISDGGKLLSSLPSPSHLPEITRESSLWSLGVDTKINHSHSDCKTKSFTHTWS